MDYPDTDRELEPVRVQESEDPVETILLGWISDARLALRRSKKKRKEFNTSSQLLLTPAQLKEFRDAS